MKKQQETLLQGLKELYHNKLLTDVNICAEGKKIPCHRSVLAASSPYFRVMFTSDVKEHEDTDVEIHEVTSSDLEMVINYIYTANIDITIMNAQNIFITANMLRILPLVELCGEFMKSQLCAHNAVEIFLFATFYSCEELEKASRCFIVETFRDVSTTDGFLTLSVEDLICFLGEDNLGVECEEEVYRALMNWIEFDLEKRQQHLVNLLKNLRLSLISSDFIENMKENTLLSEDKRILHQLNKFQTGKDVSSVFPGGSVFSPSKSSRLGMLKRRMIVFSGGASDPEERSLTCFDPTTKKNYYSIKQHSSFDFKHKIDHHRIISTADNQLFFIGGVLYEEYHFEPTASALDAVYLYEEKIQVWRKMASLGTPRCAFSAVTSPGKIIVTGGKTTFPRGGPLFTAEGYSIDDDQWLPLADMPIGLYHHASAVHRECMYVFGGITEDEEHVNTVFQYHIHQNSWTFIDRAMQNLRAEFSAVPYKDSIYLIGGGNRVENVTTVEIFNPKSKQFHIGTEFPEDRKTKTAVLIDDFIYVVGGVKYIGARGNRRSRMVESRDLYKYDLNSGDWSREVKLVQYANIQTCDTSLLNTKFLHESEFISCN